MKKSRLVLLFTTLGIVFLAACGGGVTSTPPPPPQASRAPVTVTVGDAPPVGVTILSFQVTVTGAVLQPGSVSLLSAPVKFEMKQLETETALLSSLDLPAGTYTSISVTFSNPEVTFMNNTPAPIMMGGTPCAVGAVCEFKNMPMGQSSVNYSGAPFPITVAANTPVGMLLDVDVLNSLAGNMGSMTPVMTMMNMAPKQGTGEFEDMEDVVGKVTAKDAANNQFTLQVTSGVTSMTIKVDTTPNTGTQFDFSDLGQPNTFASLAVGQVLEVDIKMMPDKTLLARKVKFEDDDVEEELEGVIVKLSGVTGFDMVLMHESIDVPGIAPGNVVTINLLSGWRTKVDDGGLPVSGLSFNGASDLMVGQVVEIERKSTPTGTPPAIDTDKVKLKKSVFTAKVKAKLNATDFTVDNLPGIFGGISQIEVRTSTQTEFSNTTGVAPLAVGDKVSLRGLLFKTVGDPVLVAKKVRKR
ncbi:MAG: DUF4382 domain-containing protein [Acidobacteria bacterium]|nr:DUF4382 domain-containing protein [Acidobacteriota bacterium]MBI3664280.1 DUF4382 domain-containing protein [Acidobacteriota bacterium]